MSSPGMFGRQNADLVVANHQARPSPPTMQNLTWRPSSPRSRHSVEPRHVRKKERRLDGREAPSPALSSYHADHNEAPIAPSFPTRCRAPTCSKETTQTWWSRITKPGPPLLPCRTQRSAYSMPSHHLPSRDHLPTPIPHDTADHPPRLPTMSPSTLPQVICDQRKYPPTAAHVRCRIETETGSWEKEARMTYVNAMTAQIGVGFT
ncbi:hypothetical protein HETIRDRAFT_103721 [Heterobasidion irregulare TC 32-1]|uniref:Uncharacterized protein n=1 Tax=Heterobasidion irregulare (strain TC 32-1) TaxID=747525 RepID=W4K1H0_HETIT|nr:uncharacterized protein HETIRDRAFT_103721 [Heterobasidion irregulare TC 32-1]ETW79657.1 hypothetical protein HETIRDRAFT_103721 [Heterobasidion irregulare TC 32-1]